MQARNSSLYHEHKGRCGLVARCRPRNQSFQARNPIPPKIRRALGLLERELPAQVSSSSSDHGSKLRGPSEKSRRVASKRTVNKTKLQSAPSCRRKRKS
ncbi:hypothetical protein AVEN_240000-1 [Araneus ventricosus]|uniref:Uncharacterized protein n=1 Tax=Araneus ventricosus TaxID=182803 RepID=A0A4Y2J2Y9_ARAVE|nr:hypothetical protein AVEN_240000-1 [Araneus ventricosus]